MKHYENLLEKGCFSREQLIEIIGTAGAVMLENQENFCLNTSFWYRRKCFLNFTGF